MILDADGIARRFRFFGLSVLPPKFQLNPLYFLTAAALLTAFAFEAYIFARVQNIWIDETTQLSGITLRFSEMLRWLSGTDPDRFGVPADRMPPFSYVLDWLWLRISGPHEGGFRLFHAMFVIVGLSILAVTARHELGAVAAILVLSFLTLSPKLIELSVEVRSYPIFFAVTCFQVALFLRLISSEATKSKAPLIAFCLCCLVSIYAHFYGIVSTCAFFGTLALASVRRRAGLLLLTIAFATVLVLSLGVLPFISHARAQSDTIIIVDSAIHRYGIYTLKLFGASPNVVSLTAALTFFGGTVALLSASLVSAIRRLRFGILERVDWLWPVVVAGVCAPIGASLIVSGFDATNASYTDWLLAPLGLLIAAGGTQSVGFSAWDKVGRKLAIAAMLAGAAWSTYIFLGNASVFIHGPERSVGRLYDQAAGKKAIVYEPGAAWGFLYFPLVFTHNNVVAQLRVPESGNSFVVIGATPPSPQDIDRAVATYDTLLVVDIRLRSYRDVAACLKGACPDFPASTAAAMLTGTGTWREVAVKRVFGLYDTQVRILERIAR
jgi:hypothetical protein